MTDGQMDKETRPKTIVTIRPLWAEGTNKDSSSTNINVLINNEISRGKQITSAVFSASDSITTGLVVHVLSGVSLTWVVLLRKHQFCTRHPQFGWCIAIVISQ